MALTVEHVRSVFDGLQTAGGAPFFAHVADDVDWTVQGTHPLAGRYRSKAAFVAGTFAKLGPQLRGGVKLMIVNIMVSGDWAIVELRADAIAKNGLHFDNRYCWLTRFHNDKIVEVRAYLDSALVAQVFAENAP
jgi:ketosteroid isomerase-like protein